MTTVLDSATNLPVDVPDGQIADLYKGGKVKLVAGKTYQLKLPDGSYGHAPAEAVSGAIDKGASFASRDEAAAQENAEKYGGLRGIAEAGASGAASFATMGVADELLPDSWRQDVQKAQQANPGVTDVGRGVGAILPAIATGGASLAEEAGAGAARLVGATGETLLGRIAQRGLANAARGAFDGAQFGVSQAVSDDAFSNHKETAEQFLSTIGTNTLWGGAIGGILGGVGGALSRGTEEAVPHAETPLFGGNTKAPTDADIGKIAGNAMGVDTPAEGLGAKARAWWAKAAAATSGNDPEQILKFTNLDNVLEADSIDATRAQAERDIRANGDSVMKAQKIVNEVWDRGMKRDYIQSLVKDVDADTAANRSRALADHAITRLNEMIDNTDKFGDSEAAASTLQSVHEYSHKLDAAIKSGDVGEMYGLTDDIKKAVGRPTKAASRLSKGAQNTELKYMQVGERQQAWKDLYATLQVGLEDENVWGKMGEAQKQVNGAYTNLIDARKRFNKALVTDIGRDPDDPWSHAYGMDPQKLGGYVKGLIQPEKDLTHQAVKDYLSNSKLLADTFAEHFNLPEGKLAAVKQIGESAQAFSDTLDKTGKSLALANQWEKLHATASGNGSAFGTVLGMIGHAVAGPVGGLAGLALGKIGRSFTHPAETLMQLAQVQKLARQSDSRVVRALSGFARGGAREVKTPELGSFARKAAEVTRAVSDPDALATRMGQNLGELRSRAPKLADAMTETGLAGLALLRDKMPPSPPGDPLNPHAKPPLLPPAQREQWLRYYEAVKNPDGVVEDLRDGRLSPEGVEVLQTVYPQKYAGIQRITFEQMASGKLKDLSHQQRIGLGMLLQVPTDPTLDPSYILTRQQAFQATQAPPPDTQGPSDKPRRPVNITKGAPTTAVERVEAHTQG